MFLSGSFGNYNLFNLQIKHLNIVLDAYNLGKDYYTINGEKRTLKGLTSIKIFSVDKHITQQDLRKLCVQNQLLKKDLLGLYYDSECLAIIGKEVTEDFIGDNEYGGKKLTFENPINDSFVNKNRLEELRKIKSTKYDLVKLIKLCEEINDNFERRNYLSVGMIGRTILNHVPPIFGLRNFDEVANHYGIGNEFKSFKRNMQNLSVSLKNISDRLLHQQIRKNETLPNETQVDFKQDLDVLLEEIVRLLKK